MFGYHARKKNPIFKEYQIDKGANEVIETVMKKKIGGIKK